MPKRTKESSDEEEENYALEEGSSEEDVEIPQKKQKKDTSDVGIIEKIELENFMCHKRLEINFGPNINFIVGVNGSMLFYLFYSKIYCSTYYKHPHSRTLHFPPQPRTPSHLLYPSHPPHIPTLTPLISH